jgi:hypothetical protein
MLVPDEGIEFFGISNICTNGTEARKLVLESAPDSHVDFWDLWVASGFLAILVVKFAVANYGLSLMTLADPFVVCAGEFLWVPTDMGMEIKTADGQTERVQFLEAFDERGRALPTEMIAKWFNSKRRSLCIIGLSKSVFWGFLVHLCMFNLFVAVQEDLGEESSLTDLLEARDMKVLTACMVFAAFVLFVGIRIVRRLNSLPKTDEQRETSDDSSAENANNYGMVRKTKSGNMDPAPSPYTRGDSQLLQGCIVQVDTFDSNTKFVARTE